MALTGVVEVLPTAGPRLFARTEVTFGAQRAALVGEINRTLLPRILFESVVCSEDMASVRSSDRLTKHQPAPSQSAVSTNQGSAPRVTKGSTKKIAASKALKTTLQPSANKNKSVGGTLVRRRVITKATGRKKSQPQPIEEQVDDSESDEQGATNVLVDETEQRGRQNRNLKCDKRPGVTAAERSVSPRAEGSTAAV